MVLGAIRRTVLLVGLFGLLAACKPEAASSQAITVYKDPNCGCCTGWVSYLQKAGFETRVVETTDRTALQSRYGLPAEAVSCHTAIVGPYLVEGHVSAADIERLLKEKPDARGLAVPGMPIGSPGMESPDGAQEPYDVLLVKRDGTTSVFVHHP